MSDGVQFGAETYRAGALERIEASRILLDHGRLALAAYTAGLAVEGMLRALSWSRSTQLDERHDLRGMAIGVQNLGLLGRGQRDDRLVSDVADVAQVWSNTLRYAGRTQFKRLLVRRGVIRLKELDRIQPFCEAYYGRCLSLVRRCELIWQRFRKPGSPRS